LITQRWVEPAKHTIQRTDVNTGQNLGIIVLEESGQFSYVLLVKCCQALFDSVSQADYASASLLVNAVIRFTQMSREMYVSAYTYK